MACKRFRAEKEASRTPLTQFSSGIRAVNIGTAMFGKRNVDTGKEEPGPRELVRLIIPRRVYTQSHVDYIIEVVEEVFRCREHLKPLRLLEQAPFL